MANPYVNSAGVQFRTELQRDEELIQNVRTVIEIAMSCIRLARRIAHSAEIGDAFDATLAGLDDLREKHVDGTARATLERWEQDLRARQQIRNTTSS